MINDALRLLIHCHVSIVEDLLQIGVCLLLGVSLGGQHLLEVFTPVELYNLLVLEVEKRPLDQVHVKAEALLNDYLVELWVLLHDVLPVLSS